MYYTFLSPQQVENINAIIELLQPYIRDIGRTTYYRKREKAVEALSSILWGYSSRDSLDLLSEVFPQTENETSGEKDSPCGSFIAARAVLIL